MKINMANKKILILGIGQSNFLNQLYSSIYDIDDSFLFSIDGYREVSKESNNLTNLPYKNYFSFHLYLLFQMLPCRVYS